MKAQYDGTCKLCDNRWYRNADIVRWAGSWVHPACRDQDVVRRRSEGQVDTLPDARGGADRGQWISSTRIRKDWAVGK